MNSNSNSNSNSNLTLCIICYMDQVDTVFKECGHMSLCHQCSTKEKIKKCPTCKVYSEWIRLYDQGFHDYAKPVEELSQEKKVKTNEEIKSLLDIETRIREASEQINESEFKLIKLGEQKVTLEFDLNAKKEELKRVRAQILQDEHEIDELRKQVTTVVEKAQMEVYNSKKKIEKDENENCYQLKIEINKLYDKVDKTPQNAKNMIKAISVLCEKSKQYEKVIANSGKLKEGDIIRQFILKNNGNYQLSKDLPVIGITVDNRIKVDKENLYELEEDEIVFRKIFKINKNFIKK